MMFDDELHSDGHGGGRKRAPDENRPLSDREVPLGRADGAISDAVHAWLDGETTESHARRGADSTREVEFWKRLDEDLAARRRLRTPAHLQAQIMNALPMHAPQLITPWWRRELVVTPTTAVTVATAIVLIAAAVTAFVLRLPR